MVIPDKYAELFRSLIDRTKEGDVDWRQTSVSEQYAVYLEKGDVAVDYYPEHTDREGRNRPEGYGVTIFNNEGDKVDEIKADRPSGGEVFSLLEELYNTAKRSYLKVDETIDGMLDEVESSDSIGGDSPSNVEEFEADDELPF